MRKPAMHTILIANRGEIALRIMRTARAEGYRTAAIYSDADARAAHVRAADIAIGIGGNTPAESYLDIDKIVRAALEAGADAVHPGYGFLAENAEFARACADRGLQFIGPGADAIELMGNKRRAKKFVQAAGVPCIPGLSLSDLEGDLSDAALIREVNHIGFPLMIKAAAGGGGRGMRLVQGEAEFAHALRSARNEARSAFGSDEIILEKALTGARHIEIQVFGDIHGNVIHLGERDCSIQRRHQKIVEESPSPALDPELRQRMGAAAVAAARACNYVGAGTVEFLLDHARNFYFLEMNTRLQVEHGVTELVTGFDLVAWQLAVARGEPLPLAQADFAQRGHAIEVRLYAEDPDNSFLPQTGSVVHWREPAADGVRADHALAAGADISPYYDPMLGKLLAWGRDREEARRRLARALTELEYLGPVNNRFFLRQVLLDPVFVAGGASTQFLERDFSPARSDTVTAQTAAIACLLLHESRIDPADRRNGRANWRSADHSLPLHYRMQFGEQIQDVKLFAAGTGEYRIEAAEETFNAQLSHWRDANAEIFIDGARESILSLLHDNILYLVHRGSQWQVRDVTHAPAAAAQRTGDGRVVAPMDGSVVEVRVAVGATVARGDILAVMEAMKMEHALKADSDGVVASVSAVAGDQVRSGQLLVQIEAADAITAAEQT